MQDNTQMLSSFPYGRTQHVRGIRSSTVSVIYYVSTRLFMSCRVITIKQKIPEISVESQM